jgi:hypothetical protein
MCGESVGWVGTWEEEVEEVNEYGVREKIRYVIEAPSQTTRFISELWLTRWNGYAAERHSIEFDGDRLRVRWGKKDNLFTTYRLIAELIYDASFEEWPWFTDPCDLGDTVEQLGVKKTFELILDYCKTLFSEPFKEVE